MRFDRACTNGSGTIGLRNAWMKTGRSSGSSASRRRVSALTDDKRSAVTSSRSVARAITVFAATSATAKATVRTAWWAHIG